MFVSIEIRTLMLLRTSQISNTGQIVRNAGVAACEYLDWLASG